jgi:hypothetical protein
MHPVDATSPKWRIANNSIRILYTHPTTHWSLASMTYDDIPDRIGIRWNGDVTDRGDLGYPSARGNGAWFILPDPLDGLVRAMIPIWNGNHGGVDVAPPASAFEKIMEGMQDAIAHAGGDHTRGRIANQSA